MINNELFTQEQLDIKLLNQKNEHFDQSLKRIELLIKDKFNGIFWLNLGIYAFIVGCILSKKFGAI
jgi:hypothetical protein